MSIIAFKPAPNNKIDPKYRFEDDSEVSVMGSYFAKAVAIVATSNRDDLRAVTSPKRNVLPLRKMYWEEPKYNPPILNTHISAGVEAHIKEEQAYWKLRGRPFPPELPQPSREKDKGPKKPEVFPYIMEKPIKQFGRKRILHPELKVTKSFHRCGEKANEVQDRVLTPLTYQTPDYWDRYRQPSPESSVAFKSKTKRFDEDPKPTANEYEIELEIQSLSSPGRNLSRPSTTLSSTRSLRDVDERNSVYRVLKSRQKGFSFATSGITRPNSPSSIEDQSGLFDSSSVISHGGDTMDTGNVHQMIAKWAPPVYYSTRPTTSSNSKKSLSEPSGQNRSSEAHLTISRPRTSGI